MTMYRSIPVMVGFRTVVTSRYLYTVYRSARMECKFGPLNNAIPQSQVQVCSFNEDEHIREAVQVMDM